MRWIWKHYWCVMSLPIYFIGYKTGEKKQTIFHQASTNGYTCSFKSKIKKALKKYESIWNEIRSIIESEFDKQRFYHGQHLNAKLKSYEVPKQKNTQRTLSLLLCGRNSRIKNLCKIKNEGSKCYQIILIILKNYSLNILILLKIKEMCQCNLQKILACLFFT